MYIDAFRKVKSSTDIYNDWLHGSVKGTTNLPHSWPVSLKASGGTPLTSWGKPFLFCQKTKYSAFHPRIQCFKSSFNINNSRDSLRNNLPAKSVSYLPKHLHCGNPHKWACRPLCWFPSSGHTCELSAIAVGIRTAGQWIYLSGKVKGACNLWILSIMEDVSEKL